MNKQCDFDLEGKEFDIDVLSFLEIHKVQGNFLELGSFEGGENKVFAEFAQGMSKSVHMSETIESRNGLFSFICTYGNYDDELAKKNFIISWDHLEPGGVLAFHNYHGDLLLMFQSQPLKEYKDQVDLTIENSRKQLLYMRKSKK